MTKRTNKKIRKVIFKILSDKKEHSYGYLERKVNTNWKTIRDHIEYMELFEAVEMTDNKIKLTNFGLKIFKKLD